MKLKMTALALALGFAAGSAQATDYTLNIDSTLNGQFGATVGHSFEDFWNFTLPSGTDGTGSADVISVKTRSSNAVIKEFELLDTTSGKVDDDNHFVTIDFPSGHHTSTIDFTGLTTGHTYALEIEGIAGSGCRNGSYAGNISINPVPEPSEWALMGAGLGLLGFVASRRSKKAAA